MPEEPQDNNQQTDTSTPPDNKSQYIKEPLPAQQPVANNPEPVFATTSEGLAMDANEVVNSESTPSPVTGTTAPAEEAPIAAVVNPFQQPDQNNTQPVKPAGPNWLKNKKLVIGIAIAAVVVLIGGGSTLAYTSWYQNPDKVLADSIINAVTAKSTIYTGDITIENTNTSFDASTSKVKVTVNITAKQADATGSLNAKLTVNADGVDYSVEGDALVDTSGDLYFKVDGLAEIVSKNMIASLIDTSNKTTSDAIDALVAKIDNKWIKISSSDLNDFSTGSSATKDCINKTTDKYKNDSAAVAELTNAYRKNPFIVIKKDLGQKDGSFGYELTNDNVALKAFAEGVKTTKIYKNLVDCDKSFEINTSSIDTTEKSSTEDSGTIELWVGTWSHQISKIVANNKDETSNVSMTITPKYNQKINISAPSESISLKELKTFIMDLTSSMYPSYDTNDPSYYSDPSYDTNDPSYYSDPSYDYTY